MKAYKKSILSFTILALILVALAFKFVLFATGENIYEQIQRFMEVVQAVNKLYFEEVDSQKLVDGAINGMLEELDPHSVYIPKDHINEITEQFEGEFEGIGIEFIVHEKIPVIISPIANSPSERIGLRSGDRIIEIDGGSTYGITQDGVREKLLGPRGSEVTIKIQRPGIEEPFDVTIVRDKIPIYSVTSAFMIDDKTGYARVGRFAKTTNDEFKAALRQLESENMKRLILDLRGNSGGYLDQAVEMADNFLHGGKRIVYTRGRIPSSNEDYYSTTEATYPELPLIILIDHGSASASEIVAGAIQDWDRGLIVGVTSFGKGLVQHQISLKDGSAVRVTIARYYTPSGRVIQRSYKNGLPDYIAEGYDDVDPNAYSDSTIDKPIYTTSSGRKVYGGGGISPDISIKSNPVTASTVKLIQSQSFFEFGSLYATKHRNLEHDFVEFRDNFEVDEKMVADLIGFAKERGVDVVDKDVDKDLDFIKRRIKSQIARHLWSSKEYHQIEVLGDNQVNEALKHFPEAAKIANLTIEK